MTVTRVSRTKRSSDCAVGSWKFPKSHILHKVFNRNNVKASYSCTSNLRNLIKQHNANILNETRNANSDGCNCRKRNSCPLDGACLASGIVYKATVTTNIGQPKIYIGSTEHSFKTRFNIHKISLKYHKHSHSTCLSKYIWEQRIRELIMKSNGQ